MADKYITHNVYLESADFNILVTAFPEDDINDKLAVLATEKGLIYKSFYEDFVLGTCMANSGPFFYHIRRRRELMEKFEEIRQEALATVYKFSPEFKPENIVINSNNILKTRKSVAASERSRELTKNELWDKDPPLTSFGPAIITTGPEPETPFQEDDGANGTELPDTPIETENPFAGGNGGGSDDVPYTLVGHKWDKLGLHINIRRYEEEEDHLIELLGGTPFESLRGYHLLIVQLCIEDFSDIFHLLDSMGVSKTVPPSELAAELYNIAIKYNPFLKLENVNLKEIRAKYRRKHKNKLKNNRRAAAASNDEQDNSTTPKKHFADVSKDRLLGLVSELKKKVVGQDEALQTVGDAVLRASVGLKREHEPLGVFLFTGSTGCGKTETAKALSDVLGASLVRIDCQEYQHGHEVAKLTGSPPGYVGYEDGGHLARSIGKTPFAVVLFDEIEKAHNNFHERILQIIDDGILTDNKGKKVSFHETIIIMTSNIGVKEVEAINRTLGFGDVATATDDKAFKAREDALKNKFKPEFLNRIDEVVHFSTLTHDNYMSILDILLAEVNDQIHKSRSLSLQFSLTAKNFLLDKGIDKKFGARPLRRTIKKYLNTPLAIAILKEEVNEGSKILINLNKSKDGLSFKESKIDSSAKHKEEV